MDPGSIAIGALVGTMFWLFALIYYFPKKFKNAEQRIEAKIEEKEAKYVALIETTKDGIDTKAILQPIIAELNKPMPEWDKDLLGAVANVTSGTVNQLLYAVENDERFDTLINGKMKGIAMNMKKEFRSELEEMVPEVAKSMGIDPEMIKGGADMLDNIPEDYRWMVQLGMMFMKGGGLGGLGGGVPGGYGGGY